MSLPNDEELRLILNEEHAIVEHPTFPGGTVVVPTTQLAEKYFKTTKKDSGLLPPVVRYVSPNFRDFLIERPPHTVKIKYRDEAQHTHEKANIEYELPLPWTVYLLRFKNTELTEFTNLYLWARNTPIYSEEDHLYRLALPNLYAEGRACDQGNIQQSINQLPAGLDTTGVINCAINAFWDSQFNRDIPDFIATGILPEFFEELCIVKRADTTVDYAASIVKYFQTWQAMNVNEMVEVPYQECTNTWYGQDMAIWNRLTVSDVINGVGQDVPWVDTRPFLTFIRSLVT